MHLDNPAHGPFYCQHSFEITGVTTVQACAADDLIYSDEQGYSVSVKTFPLEAYKGEEILVFTGQLGDSKHTVHNIEKQH